MAFFGGPKVAVSLQIFTMSLFLKSHAWAHLVPLGSPLLHLSLWFPLPTVEEEEEDDPAPLLLHFSPRPLANFCVQ